MKMALTVYLFIFGTTIASARHTLDVNRYLLQSQIDPSHNYDDRYGAQDMERRNIEYRSDVNINRETTYNVQPERFTQPITSDHHQQNTQYSYVTESDHVALISEKVSSSNDIGNDANSYRLRTNAYPSTNNEIVEYTTEYRNEHGLRAHTDFKEPNLHVLPGESGLTLKESARNIEGLNSQLHRHGSKVISQDEHIARGQQSRSMHTPDRLIPHRSPQYRENDHTVHHELSNPNRNVNGEHNQNNFTPQTNATVEDKDSAREADNLRPIEGQNIRDSDVHNSSRKHRQSTTEKNKIEKESGRAKEKEAEEEIPWVWGSSDTNKKTNTTEVDLDDRTAFDGSLCPSGFVKVMEMCVEKH